MRLIIVMISALCAASCGGRVSQPMETTRSFDDKLSCAHLLAERANNDSRVVELLGERSESVRDNVGMVISSPLFLDLKNAEKEEATAINARNSRLDALMQAADCQPDEGRSDTLGTTGQETPEAAMPPPIPPLDSDALER